MRIAISGAQYSGRTSLAAALAEKLPDFALYDDPSVTMIEDGVEISDPPTVEDYTSMANESLDDVAGSETDAIFDRCAMDFMAYALGARRGPIDLEEWLELLEEGVEGYDLIVYCPIEEPDRIAVPLGESRKLRRRVDQHLREIIIDDRFRRMSGLRTDATNGGTGASRRRASGPQVVEVSGSLDERLEQVLRAIGQLVDPSREHAP